MAEWLMAAVLKTTKRDDEGQVIEDFDGPYLSPIIPNSDFLDLTPIIPIIPLIPHSSNKDGGYTYHHCADLKITADPAKPIDKGWPAQ